MTLPETFPMEGYTSAKPAKNRFRTPREKAVAELALRIYSQRAMLDVLPYQSAVKEIAGMITRGLPEATDPLQLKTETQAASLLCVGRNTIRRLFKAVRVGERGVRYRASDLLAFIEGAK